MAFTIHTRTDIPKRSGSAAGVAYVIKEDARVVYDSAPELFPSASKARAAASRHIELDGHKLVLKPNDFI